MTTRDQNLVNELERVLKRECAVYERYLQLLEEERAWVTKFNLEKINVLNSRRNDLVAEMKELEERRLALMSRFPEYENRKLSDLIKLHCHPADAKRLLPLAAALKELVRRVQRFGGEFNQVVNFSLNMVNSSISLIWSATQNVFECYTARGQRRELFHPAHSRLATVLRSA